MKVGQFTDTFLPVVDGVGRVVSHYAQIMGELCETCYVIAPHQNKYVADNPPYKLIQYRGISLPQLRQYRVGLPRFDNRYRSQIAQIELDIVHAHSPFIAGHEAYRVARHRRIPLVATFHSKYYDDFYQITRSKTLAKLGTKYVVDFFNKCDQVWAVSTATAEVLRSYGYKGAVKVMENGTDLKVPDLAGIELVEDRYDLKQQPMLLFVGQMNWKKNIRRILEAVEILVKKGRKLRLVLIGQGPSAREIRSLASKLGLDDVMVYTGHINDAQLLEALYARADLFVFPSLYDNAPMVVREAAAVGTPSLLAQGSSAAEVVQDGVNGLLAADDTIAMATKIAWALDHPEKLKEIGMIARQTIPKPWRAIISEALKQYEDLIRVKRQY